MSIFARRWTGYGVGLGIAVTWALLLSMTGCGGGGDGAKLDIGNGAPSGAQDVSFVDLEVVRDDQDLAVVVRPIAAALDDNFANLGVKSSDLDRVLTFYLNNERVLVVEGRLREEEIRGKLTSFGFVKEKVEGTEVWSLPEGVGSVAFVRSGRMALSSNVREMDAIATQLERKQDLRSHELMSQVLNGLPAGELMSVSERCEFVAESCRAVGISLNKRDATTSDFTFVTLFDDEARALEAKSEVESLFNLMTNLYQGVETRESGSLLVSRGRVVTAELLQGLAAEFDLTP